MTSRLRRRAVLSGLAAVMGTTALARAPTRSVRPVARPGSETFRLLSPEARPTHDDMVAAARLGGTTAFVLADAATGRVLASREPEVALPPASVAKVVTGAYALDALGADHRFVTRVLATGPVVGGGGALGGGVMGPVGVGAGSSGDGVVGGAEGGGPGGGVGSVGSRMPGGTEPPGALN